MDIRLKKSKRVKSFIYRMIAAGALFTAIATGILGREALVNMYHEGLGTLTGDIYYSTEFREFTAFLYNKGMLGYAGIGDDNGYPLTDEKAAERAADAKDTFLNELASVDNNLIYYVEYNGQVMESNTSYPVFSEYDGHLLLPEDTTLCCYWDGENEKLQFFSETYRDPSDSRIAKYYDAQYQPNMEKTGKIKLFLAVKEPLTLSYTHSGYLNLLGNRSLAYRNLLIAFFISVAVTVIFWFASLFTVKAGKQGKKDYAGFISKVPFELRLLAIIGAFYFCDCLNLWDFDDALNGRIPISANWGFYFPAGMLLYLLYIDLKENEMEVLKQTFIYRLFRHFRKYQTALSWYRKAMNMYHMVLISAVFLFAVSIISLIFYIGFHNGTFYIGFRSVGLRFIFYAALPGLLIVSLALGLGLLLYSFRLKSFVNDVASINDNLSAISAGNESMPLKLSNRSLLTQTAENLNTVDNGIQNAVEQKNRSNKMRVELLTNVSHDLKTPLTSIINYAELLCEEDLPAPASEYADSLRIKAYRLKSMVQDVFDLSKATSGNMNVEKTRLDLVKLIRQTLADMDERISESSLIFKLNIADEPLFIEADGEKLYRVFQNLIINALQYSLENSRVHVLLEKKGAFAYAKIKNTSRQELNFSADEITERFVRADSSRTTEGSGLGLSIVQSFTEACGGTFTIEMDADLFTACVVFPLVEDAPEGSQPSQISQVHQTVQAEATVSSDPPAQNNA